MPNLITGKGACRAAATKASYKEGVTHAVRSLAPLAAAVYLDAGHGGWMSFVQNINGFADLIASMAIAPSLRGFALNTANYQPLGEGVCEQALLEEDKPSKLRSSCKGAEAPACCGDPCHVLASWGWGNSELHYAVALQRVLSHRVPGFTPHSIIDTSRNGNSHARSGACTSWCNVRDAALGAPPSASTALPETVDAYFWVKPPGESDGCSSRSCPRFDSHCRGAESLGPGSAGARPDEPEAPDAGQIFPYQLVQLATRQAEIPPPPPPPPMPPLRPLPKPLPSSPSPECPAPNPPLPPPASLHRVRLSPPPRLAQYKSDRVHVLASTAPEQSSAASRAGSWMALLAPLLLLVCFALACCFWARKRASGLRDSLAHAPAEPEANGTANGDAHTGTRRTLNSNLSSIDIDSEPPSVRRTRRKGRRDERTMERTRQSQRTKKRTSKAEAEGVALTVPQRETEEECWDL